MFFLNSLWQFLIRRLCGKVGKGKVTPISRFCALEEEEEEEEEEEGTENISKKKIESAEMQPSTHAVPLFSSALSRGEGFAQFQTCTLSSSSQFRNAYRYKYK